MSVLLIYLGAYVRSNMIKLRVKVRIRNIMVVMVVVVQAIQNLDHYCHNKIQIVN